MLRMIFLLALNFSTGIELHAKENNHQTTLAKLFGQSKDKIKISACQKFNLNPAEIFNTIKYKTSFNKNCDLQGEVGVKLLVPFPIKIETKNLSHYKELLGTGKINLGLENPPKILAEITKGELQGKDTIYFNAYYSGEVLPAKTLKVKPGTESVRVEIYDKAFSKIKETFNLKIK